MARYELTDRDAARFWSKVIKGDGCWTWAGSHFQKTGYAIFNVKMADGVWRPTYAHRVAHEVAVGPIPERFTIDHLCRQPGCVRPDHLEAVTQRTNILRSDGPSARQARWTECPRGHPFSAKNTYIRPSGKRECRTCMQEREQKRTLKVATFNCVICGNTFTAQPRFRISTCSRSCCAKLGRRSRR